MLRLTRYLKPYLLLIIFTVVLLFIQAYANLALPDYMSDIVNIGIQQGGVENAVPLAVSKKKMDMLLLFMKPGEAKQVLSDYSLIDTKSPDFKQNVLKYPALRSEAVYVRKNIQSKEIQALNPVMGKAWVIVSGGNRPAFAKKGFDPAKLLKGMSESERTLIMQKIMDKINSMSPKMIIQAASIPIRQEYDALGMDKARLSIQYMYHTGALMLLLTLISALAAITTGLLSARIAVGFARDLRAALFTRVENFSAAEFDTFSTASLITRSTNDIMQIQTALVMLVSRAFYAPIIGIGGIIRAVGKSTSMWWIIALAVGILIMVIFSIYKVIVPKFKVMQKLMDKLNLVGREILSGMMVIRAFNMETHEEKRFDGTNRDLTQTMLSINRVIVVLMPVLILIMNGISLLIIWIGAKQVAASSMQVGDMMAFMQYAMQIVFAFLMLSMMFIMIPRAAVSGGRVAEVLETAPSVTDPEEPESFGTGFDGTVEFRGVSFRYPGAEEDALHDISFTVKKGETTAIIGATGSGKSTIVHLIPRFYDVSTGTVFVGGKDVRRVTQHELRDKIGYVPQKSTLFSGTIRENLQYGDENAKEEKLMEAAELAQISDFIHSSPDGMDSEISQAGVNVSGGQKQRLSIARTVVKNPPIYIFDDSFSALDFKTDAEIRQALKIHARSSSIIIVAQRVATVKQAQQIIVLDEGRIVGKGTHKELMETCRPYREIAMSQLTMEELA